MQKNNESADFVLDTLKTALEVIEKFERQQAEEALTGMKLSAHIVSLEQRVEKLQNQLKAVEHSIKEPSLSAALSKMGFLQPASTVEIDDSITEKTGLTPASS